MRWLRWTLLVGIAGLAASSWGGLLAPAPAAAQAVDVIDVDPRRPDVKVLLEAGYEHEFASDIDDPGNPPRSGGDFTRDSASLYARPTFDLGDRFSLSPILRWENHSYRFANEAKALGFAWNDVNYGMLGLLASWKIDAKWSLLGGPVVRYQGEAGAHFDDSLDGGGVFGFLYQPNPRLTTGLVIGVVSAIEEDLAIVPIPFVRWQAGDTVAFDVGVQRVGARSGVGAGMRWQASKRVELGLGGAFVNRRFRLDDHGRMQRAPTDAIGRQPGVARGRSVEGIGQDRSFPVFVRLALEPFENASLDILTAVAFGGQLTVEEKYGDQIQRQDYDPTPLVGVQASYRF